MLMFCCRATFADGVIDTFVSDVFLFVRTGVVNNVAHTLFEPLTLDLAFIGLDFG